MKKCILIASCLLTLCSVSAKTPAWTPAGNDIKTKWAAEVNPAAPLPEYPRPEMVRPDWMNLNGLWNYAITPEGETPVTKGKFAAEGKILGPFALESSLSGVKRVLQPDQALWYERNFTMPKAWKGKKVMLNFGAVDWKAEVWVNGSKVGEHTGGYAPFSFDITAALKKSGAQTVRVKVQDSTDQIWQPRGKQVLYPQGIWYTSVSGIWQTVWLEAVPQAGIVSYSAVSDIDAGKLKVSVKTSGLTSGDEVKVTLLSPAKGYSTEKPSNIAVCSMTGSEVELSVPAAKLWTPDNPWLYGLEISVLRGGKQIDKVEGYTAFRKISAVNSNDSFSSKPGQGYRRMALNNEVLFQFGPLDQGWWPDGLYTAPTDEALRYDIEKTREWGFNMIRKHVKVEPARWYYWCDVLGVVVWQDMPCIADHNKTANFGRPEKVAAGQRNRWPNDSFIGGSDCVVPEAWKQNYYKEWGEIISSLKGHPCIVVWVPFNEGWGQFDTEDVVRFTKKMDPERLVNEASGGNYHLCGDILDAHHYPEPMLNVFERRMVNVLGEYGGIGYHIAGHVWRPSGKNWGYAGLCSSPEEVLERYRLFADRLKVFITTGCGAAVYTQTTDVEIELNGLMTYDRLEKVPADAIRAINRDVIATPLWSGSAK